MLWYLQVLQDKLFKKWYVCGEDMEDKFILSMKMYILQFSVMLIWLITGCML